MSIKTVKLPLVSSIFDIIVSYAQNWPRRTAIQDHHKSISYQDLVSTIKKVQLILDGQSLGPGSRVALLAEKNADAVAIMLSVMSCGAAISVLPPKSSDPVLLSYIQTIKTDLLITVNKNAPSGYTGPIIRSDDIHEKQTDNINHSLVNICVPDDPAYLVFTSGSTGKPKVVVVTHRNIVHYSEGVSDKLGLSGASPITFAHVTTLAADLGYTSIFPTLLVGGRVLVLDDISVRDPEKFWLCAKKFNITHLKTTPSHFAALLENGLNISHVFDTIVLGGERFSIDLAKKTLDSNCTKLLVNHYGPSETTIGTSCFLFSKISDIPSSCKSVPIGSAIGRSSLFLDPKTKHLLVSGPCVTNGYFEEPNLTNKSFIKTIIPTDNELQVAYDTGDVCCEVSPGFFEFEGRNDRRVKIRGYLVDLSLVESIVEENCNIKQAYVYAAGEGGTSRLVAAVAVAKGHQEELQEKVREYIADKLPYYMVPSYVAVLESLPTNENGKVDKQLVLNAVNNILGKSNHALKAGSVSRTADYIANICADSLGINNLSVDDDLFQKGMDSILVMKLVSRLRKNNFDVSVNEIYEGRTSRKLSENLSGKKKGKAEVFLETEEKKLAPQQKWFFEQKIDDPNLWNQAILLASSDKIDVTSLSQAISNSMKRHNLLRQKFTNGQPAGLSHGADALALSSSALPREGVSEYITKSAELLHKTLDLENGFVFRAHLFFGDTCDYLLFIAHHLVVDGISWRVLLEDIACDYKTSLDGLSLESYIPTPFWDWTKKIEGGTPEKVRILSSCKQLSQDPLSKPCLLSRSKSIALSFSQEETDSLFGDGDTQELIQATLLQAYAEAVGKWNGAPNLRIDVEGHGRNLAENAEEFYSTVGWFTSIKSVTLQIQGNGSFRDRVQDAKEECDKDSLEGAGLAGATSLCFNYLGEFVFPIAPQCNWVPANHYVGLARSHNRSANYSLTFTARIIAKRLVCDLTYSPSYISSFTAQRILSSIQRTLSQNNKANMGYQSCLPGSSAGLLMLQPEKPVNSSSFVSLEKQDVLLTGSTGFLGAHILAELSKNNNYTTHCLVRGGDEEGARARLFETCRFYFGEDIATNISQKTKVIVGDITRSNLGITTDSVTNIRFKKVFHAAAFTRLLAKQDVLNSINVDGARNVLKWSEDRNIDELHYVSTLAVAGHFADKGLKEFSEEHFDIGQTFLTPYEKSKFEAEKLIRESIEDRKKTIIYRMGHIAAHSENGVFQENIADNRIYQIIKGLVELKAFPFLPQETIAFSHVDIIAQAITEASLSDLVDSSTLHVESPYKVSQKELVTALQAYGYYLKEAPLQDFLSLAEHAGEQGNKDALLVGLWTQRSARNIEYSEKDTIKVLSKIGVKFPQPTQEWIVKAIHWAANVGYLPMKHPRDMNQSGVV